MLLQLADIEMELNVVLEALNAQIDEIGVIAKTFGSNVHELRTTSGRGLLVEPLVAKAHVLIALKEIQEGKDVQRPES